MRISLRQLEVFTAIATHGGVTRAAEHIAMTQAAASMALADLERQLNTTLFDRVGRQLVLNDMGRLVLARAQDVLDRAHEIETISQNTGFDLHLGASVTIGNHLLPAVIAKIKQSYPESRIRVSRFNTEQVIEELLAFRIDLGFIEGPVHSKTIQRFTWRQDNLLLFAAPDHPFTQREISPKELEAVPWIVREHGSGTREVLEWACLQHGVHPNISLELEQPEAIRQCVRAGLGIGCLSELELEEPFHRAELSPIRVAGMTMPRELQIGMHREKYPGKGIRAIFDTCGIQLEGD